LAEKLFKSGGASNRFKKYASGTPDRPAAVWAASPNKGIAINNPQVIGKIKDVLEGREWIVWWSADDEYPVFPTDTDEDFPGNYPDGP
jgi:hypothetical protein